MSGNASVICCRIGRRLAHILRLLRKSSGALTNIGTAVETRSVPQARRDRRSSSSDFGRSPFRAAGDCASGPRAWRPFREDICAADKRRAWRLVDRRPSTRGRQRVLSTHILVYACTKMCAPVTSTDTPDDSERRPVRLPAQPAFLCCRFRRDAPATQGCASHQNGSSPAVKVAMSRSGRTDTRSQPGKPAHRRLMRR
jgi:hypothetical protein